MVPKVRGFTLLEVLVALAIFAVASVSLLAAQNAQVRTDGRLADKTLAHWAALNRLAEMQLQGLFPDPNNPLNTFNAFLGAPRMYGVTLRVRY